MTVTMADASHIMASSRVRMDGSADDTTGVGTPPASRATAAAPAPTGSASAPRPTLIATAPHPQGAAR